jgi:hypothetical protein
LGGFVAFINTEVNEVNTCKWPEQWESKLLTQMPREVSPLMLRAIDKEHAVFDEK